ncbi:MAG: VTT domain-containing protein [Enterococcus sp.]
MFIIDFIMHVDEHLLYVVQHYGLGIYLLLFAVIFIETGLVIFPFLPGDSLLFAAGALVSISEGILKLPLILGICILASILGNTVNYWVGRSLGTQVLYSKKVSRFIKEAEVKKAENFFNDKGKYTIFIGRFIPFIRTFIPFIAGSSHMKITTFTFYNVISAICWVGIATFAGYFLGNIPFIHEHFSIIMLGIIAVSLVPIIFSALKGMRNKGEVVQ